MTDRAGNLFEPVPGPAAIDGEAKARVTQAPLEIFDGRQRDLFKLGAAAGIGGAGCAAGFGLGRMLPRLPILP